METTTKSTPRGNSGTQGQGIERASAGSGQRGAPGDLQEAWENASQSIETLYNRASATLQTQVQERPYAAIATAAGLGFILGGGLSSPTGRLLLRTAAQVAVPIAMAKLRGEE